MKPIPVLSSVRSLNYSGLRACRRHASHSAEKRLPVTVERRRLFSLSAPRRDSPVSFKRHTMPTTPASAGDGTGPARPPGAKHVAYIALGSNIGDRIAMIERACREMDQRGIRVRRTSSLWETEPMYVLDQDRFVNGACEVETDLEPLALLDQLQDIERSMGRKKLIDKGPRNIDLDILLYDQEKIDHERLQVPHISIPEREFVLRPLAELVPNKPIDPSRPWRLTQDYLNDLTPASPPLTTLTPLAGPHPPLQALNPSRKTHVMAILNVTPDSFSDGGLHTPSDPSSLATTVRAFLAAGATMLDVGGQSTAPHAPEVSTDVELSRVLPAVALIRSLPEARHALISVDTYRAAVAAAAVQAGADMINDVTAGRADRDMLPTAARLGATLCLMHSRGTPATMNSLAEYPGGERGGVVGGIARELAERVAAAEAAGVRRWRMVLDPGLGFAKRGAQNLDVIRRLDELREWPGLQGLPWLVGSSRKSFIGEVTGVAEPRERVWGTAATVAAAVHGGADVVRVHDVKEMAQVVAMADAIWRR